MLELAIDRGFSIGPRLRRAASFCALLGALLTASFAHAAEGSITTAPDWKGEDLDGKTHELKTLLAKGPVLLNFWATWCKPCMQELPEVQKLWDKYKDQGFSFVTVAYDDAKSVGKVKPLAKSKGFRFPVILDPEHKIANPYSVRNCPTSFLIAPDGKIVSIAQGYRPGDEKALEEEIVKLLPKKS
ncbi:MAG: redoxin domain-containing protein [Candidatus Eisenbacteria bacterium]|nr:redoxin domain-containing protein [Candidatus Eisenbacteria bacterium]MCC7142885.1 redoxin domain-containing protein [Candidatus Eisenbacteria bacterium]